MESNHNISNGYPIALPLREQRHQQFLVEHQEELMYKLDPMRYENIIAHMNQLEQSDEKPMLYHHGLTPVQFVSNVQHSCDTNNPKDSNVPVYVTIPPARSRTWADAPEFVPESRFVSNRNFDALNQCCYLCGIAGLKLDERFGIMPNCEHVFCLMCIRNYRRDMSQVDSSIAKNCPRCNVRSNFVYPSLYCFDTPDRKNMQQFYYLTALTQIHCKYFRNGKGACPFGNRCFYKHVLIRSPQSSPLRNVINQQFSQI